MKCIDVRIEKRLLVGCCEKEVVEKRIFLLHLAIMVVNSQRVQNLEEKADFVCYPLAFDYKHNREYYLVKCIIRTLYDYTFFIVRRSANKLRQMKVQIVTRKFSL